MVRLVFSNHRLCVFRGQVKYRQSDHQWCGKQEQIIEYRKKNAASSSIDILANVNNNLRRRWERKWEETKDVDNNGSGGTEES